MWGGDRHRLKFQHQSSPLENCRRHRGTVAAHPSWPRACSSRRSRWHSVALRSACLQARAAVSSAGEDTMTRPAIRCWRNPRVSSPLPDPGLVDSTLLLLGGDYPLLVPLALGHPSCGSGISDLGEGLLGGDGLEVHGHRPDRPRHGCSQQWVHPLRAHVDPGPHGSLADPVDVAIGADGVVADESGSRPRLGGGNRLFSPESRRSSAVGSAHWRMTAAMPRRERTLGRRPMANRCSQSWATSLVASDSASAPVASVSTWAPR